MYTLQVDRRLDTLPPQSPGGALAGMVDGDAFMALLGGIVAGVINFLGATSTSRC